MKFLTNNFKYVRVDFISFKFIFCILIITISLLLAAQSSASFITTWQATNKTGHTVSDFEAIFTGTGGSVADAMIVMNDASAGEASITGSTNTIKIDWNPDKYFPDTATVVFKFTTDYSEIAFNSGKWTRTALNESDISINAGPDGNTIIKQVPEPSTLFLFGAGLAGVLVLGRKSLSKKTGACSGAR